MFFNSLEHLSISGNIVYDLTDHLPNFLIVKKLSSLSSNVKIFKRDYSHLDEAALINDFKLIDWELTLINNNPESMFDTFYTKNSGLVDKHIPIKQVSKRELNIQTKPWITPAIKASIQVKNKLYKRFLKQNLPITIINSSSIGIK
jgi:hypothetical protein